MEPVRQGMEQKATDKFVRFDGHDLAVAALAVILPAKADLPVRERDQAAVGNRNAMRVARQIGQHLLRACERGLGIDHPFRFAQRREVGPECTCFLEAGKIVSASMSFGKAS